MLNFENFDLEVIEKKATAAVIFTADWCKPSRLQREIVDELKQEFADKALIELIDVDQDEKLAERFNARTLPTTVLLAQGETIEILPGYQTLDFLQSYLRHIIKQVEEAKAEEKQTEA